MRNTSFRNKKININQQSTRVKIYDVCVPRLWVCSHCSPSKMTVLWWQCIRTTPSYQWQMKQIMYIISLDTLKNWLDFYPSLYLYLHFTVSIKHWTISTFTCLQTKIHSQLVQDLRCFKKSGLQTNKKQKTVTWLKDLYRGLKSWIFNHCLPYKATSQHSKADASWVVELSRKFTSLECLVQTQHS